MEILEADGFVTLKNSHGIRKDILEDLCSRFLINIPEEEKNDMVRICFQIELAHWFYLDFFRQENPLLPGYGVQQFMEIKIFANWKKYKYEVPVYGAIMLDQSLGNCILVRGYHKRISWGFPKGKVNKDEGSIECAVREVKEETGFDLTGFIDENTYLERNFHDHRVRLYIAPGVPINSHFGPKTRQEIKEIKWFTIDALPSHKKDTICRDILGLNASSFFMVQPFVKDLRKWVYQRKHKLNEQLSFSESISIPIRQSQYSAFTPILNETSRHKMVDNSREDEEGLRRRKEEEQKRFQEIQLNAHPLKDSSCPNNERTLRDLLGISAQGQPNRQSPVKNTENQPEAIRRLLTGTVGVSPGGTAGITGTTVTQSHVDHDQDDLLELSLTSKRGKKNCKKGKRSLDFAIEVPVPSPLEPSTTVSISKQAMRSGDFKRDVIWAGGLIGSKNIVDDLPSKSNEAHFPKRESRGWYENEIAKDECIQQASSTFTEKKASQFHQRKKSRNMFSDSNESFVKKQSVDQHGDSCFSVKEFMDFKFDVRALIATLPPATIF